MTSGNPNATNYYDRLGVSESDDCDEIETAARPIVPEYHPDRNPDSTTEKFQRIKEARSVLTDQTDRDRYDTNPVELRVTAESNRVPTDSTVEISVVDGDGVGVAKTTVTTETKSESFETNGNGITTVQFSEPGTWTVKADKHDHKTIRYVSSETDIVVEESHRELSIQAKPKQVTSGDEISVTVTDDNGAPVSHATLIVEDTDGAEQKRKTDSTGCLEFKIETPGTYHLTSQKDGFEAANTVVEVSSATELTINVLTNKLHSKNPFAVVVRDQHGSPVDNVPVDLTQDGSTVDSGRSDRDGTVQVTAPTKGTYTIKTGANNAENTTRKVYVSTETGAKDDSTERQRTKSTQKTGSTDLQTLSVPLVALFSTVNSFPVLSRVATMALILVGMFILTPRVGISGSMADASLTMGLCVLSFVSYDILPKTISDSVSPEPDFFGGIQSLAVGVLLAVATGFLLVGQGSIGETLGSILFITIIPVVFFLFMSIFFGIVGLVVGLVFDNWTAGGGGGAILGGGLTILWQFSTWGLDVKDQANSGEYGISMLPWAVIDDFTILFVDVGMIITFTLSIFVLATISIGSLVSVIILFNHPRQRWRRGEYVIPLFWELSAMFPIVLFAWAVSNNIPPVSFPLFESVFATIVVTESGLLEFVWLPFVVVVCAYGLREWVEPSYANWRES